MQTKDDKELEMLWKEFLAKLAKTNEHVSKLVAAMDKEGMSAGGIMVRPDLLREYGIRPDLLPKGFWATDADHLLSGFFKQFNDEWQRPRPVPRVAEANRRREPMEKKAEAITRAVQEELKERNSDWEPGRSSGLTPNDFARWMAVEVEAPYDLYSTLCREYPEMAGGEVSINLYRRYTAKGVCEKKPGIRERKAILKIVSKIGLRDKVRKR